MRVTSKIAPCLWFDGQAEEAANPRIKKIDIAGLERAVAV